MEIGGNFPAAHRSNIIRKKMIQRIHQPAAWNFPICEKADTEFQRMDKRIRSAAPLYVRALAQNLFKRSLENFLNGNGIFLYLPAVVPGAVIPEG